MRSEHFETTLLSELIGRGIAHVPDFLSGSELESIVAEFDRLMETHDVVGVETHADRGYLVSRRATPAALSAAFPAMARFVQTPWLRRLAEAYMGRPILYPQKVFFARSQHSETQKRELPYLMHTDKHHMFKVMLYLSDVTSEAGGPFRAVPGLHEKFRTIRQDWIASGKCYKDRPNVIEDALSPTAMLGKAGTLLIFDTDVPHQAGEVAPGHMRKAMRIDVIEEPKAQA